MKIIVGKPYSNSSLVQFFGKTHTASYFFKGKEQTCLDFGDWYISSTPVLGTEGPSATLGSPTIYGEMAELAIALVLKTRDRKVMGDRDPLSPPFILVSSFNG